MTLYNSAVLLDVTLSAVLGALIGLERELAGKNPSLRTFGLISLGSCIFAILSAYTVQNTPNADPSRMAAQVISGIGFLGAGAIFRSGNQVSGLTTAALMWVTAGIGLAVGFQRYDVAVSGTILALTVNVGLRYVHRAIRFFRPDYYHLED